MEVVTNASGWDMVRGAFMQKILTPREVLQPRIVTFAELFKALFPLTGGWPWAVDAIRDLWLLGAPVPSLSPTNVEMRILLPQQFQKWFAEIQQRMGLQVSPGDMYATASKGLPTNNLRGRG